MVIFYSSENTAPHLSEISLKIFRMWKIVSVHWLEGEWSGFAYRKQVIIPTPIDQHCQSPKATHQGIIQTKNWYAFLNLIQEYPSHLCTQEGNNNKWYYLPTDTYLGIDYVLYHPGYIVIGLYLPFKLSYLFWSSALIWCRCVFSH